MRYQGKCTSCQHSESQSSQKSGQSAGLILIPSCYENNWKISTEVWKVFSLKDSVKSKAQEDIERYFKCHGKQYIGKCSKPGEEAFAGEKLSSTGGLSLGTCIQAIKFTYIYTWPQQVSWRGLSSRRLNWRGFSSRGLTKWRGFGENSRNRELMTDSHFMIPLTPRKCYSH